MEKVDIKSKNAVTYCEINRINEVQNTDFDIMNLCMNNCNNCSLKLNIESHFDMKLEQHNYNGLNSHG